MFAERKHRRSNISPLVACARALIISNYRRAPDFCGAFFLTIIIVIITFNRAEVFYTSGIFKQKKIVTKVVVIVIVITY